MLSPSNPLALFGPEGGGLFGVGFFCQKFTNSINSALKSGKIIQSRRIVGEVVDFGVDVDGRVHVIIVQLNFLASLNPKLDKYLFLGPFAEVARRYAHTTLYKLPYSSIHDAYDRVTLGEQTYFNVLKHLICDTLQRFRVKTVKIESSAGLYDPKAPKGAKEAKGSKNKKNRGKRHNFYYGFTEEGYHFSKSGRRIYTTQITPEMRSLKTSNRDGYEMRQSFDNGKWLNLGPYVTEITMDDTNAASKSDNKSDNNMVKKGYIIYGRLLQMGEMGQQGDNSSLKVKKVEMTLEWCTPSLGMDLLRVYLATNGQSPVFRNLSKQEILQKLYNHKGMETLASKLFMGIINPNTQNDAINYVRQELMHF